MSEKEVDRMEETPHTEEDLDSKIVDESNTDLPVPSDTKNLEKLPKVESIGENIHTEEELQNKSVGESQIKSSETEIMGELSQLMVDNIGENIDTEEELQNKTVGESQIKSSETKSMGELSQLMVDNIDENIDIEEELQNKIVDESSRKSSETDILGELSVLMFDIFGENIDTEEELQYKTVGETQIKSSETEILGEVSKLMSAGMGEAIQREAQDENLEQPLQPMAICSEETSVDQTEDTRKYLCNIIEDLQNILKPHYLTITEFVHSNQIIYKNSSTFIASNLEKPQVDLAEDNGGAEEQLQFYQCKQAASMSHIVQDLQQTFQKHGMMLKNTSISCIKEAGESPCLSETEESDEESMDFPEPPAKRRKCNWYIIEATLNDGKDELPGPSGIHPSTSKTSDGQDQVICSSESETDS